MSSGSAYHYVNAITGGNQGADLSQGNVLRMEPIAFSGGRRIGRRTRRTKRFRRNHRRTRRRKIRGGCDCAKAGGF